MGGGAAESPGWYADLTVNNRSVLKRFSHGRRFGTSLSLVEAGPGDWVLDYGTGNAHFPRALVEARPGVHVVAYEPVASQRVDAELACADVPRIIVAASPPPRSDGYQWVTCFEVLEHLDDKVQSEVLRDLRDAVAPGGRIVVSVPLEVGLAGILKNGARMALHQTHAARPRDYLRLVLGLPIARSYPDGYSTSHVGFDHRRLLARFPAFGLAVERTVYSPFPALGGAVNSQVFWVLRRA